MLDATMYNDGIRIMHHTPEDPLPPLDEILRSWVTPRQAADKYARSPQRIHQLIQDKSIRAIKIGTSWMIDPNSLEAHFAKGRED